MEDNNINTIEDVTSPEDLLKYMENNSCNYGCFESVNAYKPRTFDRTSEKIEYLIQNLPSYSYIKGQMINFIFSNRLSTNVDECTDKLDKFLQQKNLNLCSNYNVLKTAIDISTDYGESGLRWYEGSWYAYSPDKFITVVNTHDGIKEIIGFLINKKNERVSNIDIDTAQSYEAFLSLLQDKNLMYVPTEDFCLLRNDTRKLHGVCRLNSDKLRIDMMVTAYERLINDLKYDGPGRIIIRPKDNFASSLNDVPTSAILSNNVKKQKERNNNAKNEAQRVSGILANSKPDSVILLSNAFDKDVVHLPRVVKSTEMLEWLENEDSIVAEVLGVNPSLVELGKYNGNVSMEKIIDNAMLNVIVPLRDNYSIQFSPFVKKHLGFDDDVDVYFDKYKLQQTENENDIRREVATIMNTMSLSIKNNENMPKDIQKQINESIKNLNIMLNDSLKDKDGTIKHLL